MEKNKIDSYECRQYFQHSTLTFINQDYSGSVVKTKI